MYLICNIDVLQMWFYVEYVGEDLYVFWVRLGKASVPSQNRFEHEDLPNRKNLTVKV